MADVGVQCVGEGVVDEVFDNPNHVPGKPVLLCRILLGWQRAGALVVFAKLHVL